MHTREAQGTAGRGAGVVFIPRNDAQGCQTRVEFIWAKDESMRTEDEQRIVLMDLFRSRLAEGINQEHEIEEMVREDVRNGRLLKRSSGVELEGAASDGQMMLLAQVRELQAEACGWRR